MKLLLVSHKVCWPSAASTSGYVTDGGFPAQVGALSELFESTTVAVPCAPQAPPLGTMPLVGRGLAVVPLMVPAGRAIVRKALLPVWLAQNVRVLLRELRRADAVHVPIPGDVGTIAMLLAFVRAKPLFVRHCGNWLEPRTAAELFWKWFMERFAGGRNVMLATGGSGAPPSPTNPALEWIFSTSLTDHELAQFAVPRELPATRRRLITVSRQEPAKGTAVVLEALALLRERCPDAALDVVGDGTALPALERQAATLGIADRVVFHGRVDRGRVMQLLQQADIFCYPTAASEGFPKVVLEALACGLPVVTTRVSVLPDLIGGGGGLLIDEATAAALAHAVGSVFADASRYRTMSVRAIETARRYSLEKWRRAIGDRLQRAWGPLDAPNPA